MAIKRNKAFTKDQARVPLNDETAAVLARADDDEWETITIDDLKAERATGVF